MLISVLGHTGEEAAGVLSFFFFCYLRAEKIRLALAFNAKPLVMRVHLHPEDYQAAATDWMS